jgi:hypothetical protein
MKQIIFPSILFGLVISLFSCRKDKQEENVYSIFSARDNAKAESLWNDIYDVVDEVASETNGIKTLNFPCVDTCIVDTLSNPKTLLIDFGDDDCEGNDGKNRTGQIYVTFTGRYREPGTVITVTPQNYYIDGFQVEGTKTITNNGLNDNGDMYFSIVVSDASITAPDDEYVISWESTRTRTWIEGRETFAFNDDVYEVSGSGSGVNRNGEAFSVDILEPLRIDLGCNWRITAGVVQTTPENGAVRTKDYGDGACDGLVTVTVDGQVYTFYM